MGLAINSSAIFAKEAWSFNLYPAGSPDTSSQTIPWLAHPLANGSIPVLILVIATGMPDLMMNVILLPWVIYVSVGCWRSSEKYKGPKFWSVLVKFLVIIGIISTIVQIFSGLSY